MEKRQEDQRRPRWRRSPFQLELWSSVTRCFGLISNSKSSLIQAEWEVFTAFRKRKLQHLILEKQEQARRCLKAFPTCFFFFHCLAHGRVGRLVLLATPSSTGSSEQIPALSSTGDRSHVSSAERQDSDGDDSDGPDDEDNEDNEEEEDSQPESGLSTNPSVSASPQHLSCRESELPPSALLAQMSIRSVSLLPVQPVSESQPATGPMSISGSFSPAPADASDTESVHMMSPVSPCRQMSIDYPDVDLPPSPPAVGKSSKLGQVRDHRGPLSDLF